MSPYEPPRPRIKLFDRASGCWLMLAFWHCLPSPWLFYQHPDGQWVSLREATLDDCERIALAAYFEAGGR